MKKWKQALALVLALVMALSLVALPSFAADEDAADGTLPNGVSVVNPGGPTEGVTGMEMSKTLQLNADGKTGILTLEAYATGQSQVVQKDVPLDIVLVLDTSGSMKDYMETYSISPNGTYYYYDEGGFLGYDAGTSGRTTVVVVKDGIQRNMVGIAAAHSCSPRPLYLTLTPVTPSSIPMLLNWMP